MDRIASFVLTLLLLPTHALAWGPAAHRIVAQLAEHQLNAPARADMKHLLAVTHDAALADVATWADDLRDLRGERALWRSTAPSHFVNFGSSGCRYEATHDCAGGRCVVAAIERNARVLGDRSRGDAERAQALRFLVHFVADVHQPLHAGYRKDKGGNVYQIRMKGRHTNLHSIWDSPVLASRHIGWERQARLLASTPLPHATGSAAQWAEESCRATRDDGIYPRTHTLDEEYLDRMRPLAEERVREAASRLAAVLNRELGGHARLYEWGVVGAASAAMVWTMINSIAAEAAPIICACESCSFPATRGNEQTGCPGSLSARRNAGGLIAAQRFVRILRSNVRPALSLRLHQTILRHVSRTTSRA